MQIKRIFKIIKSQETGSIETLINEVVDNLINNPGKPVKWDEYEKGTPGLAIINEEGQIIPNSISYIKFKALGKNYKKFITENSFHSKIKSSMELIPQKSTISSVKIGHNDESSIVYSVNRIVKCDFFRKYVIKDFQNDGKCNHEHSQNTHSCNYFKIFKGNLKSSNYYLIINENEAGKLTGMESTDENLEAIARKLMELFGSVGKGGVMPKADTDAIVRRVVEEVLRTMGK